MKFELTISGLCVIAMKTSDKENDPQPKHPQKVDIIVPDAHHHQCRLVWAPEDLTRAFVEPELIVDTVGHRLGSLNMKRRNLRLLFPQNADTGFDVHWGDDPDQKAPNMDSDDEKKWMNWVPMMESIGFAPVTIPKQRKKVTGARARINLPFGTITAAEIVTRPGVTSVPLLWKFADDSVRAVANKVVYTMPDFTELDLQDAKGKTLLRLAGAGNAIIRMCLSNDTKTVPLTFNDGITELTHLSHVSVLEPRSAKAQKFKAPQQVDTEHTGDIICTQVVNVYDTRG
jgi:hypothetical protein